MKRVDTGAEKKQSMVCPGWLHNSILISNFLHFDDRKNPSQFRQKMNVYGLVRPQVLILKSWPKGREHLGISTNEGLGPVTMLHSVLGEVRACPGHNLAPNNTDTVSNGVWMMLCGECGVDYHTSRA